MSIFMWKEPIIISDMKGPCDNGFHIPTDTEWTNLINAGVSLGAWTESRNDLFTAAIKLPLMGAISGSSGTSKYDFGTYIYYWTCIGNDTNARYLTGGTSISGIYNSATSNGCPIRAFKDTPTTPDISWTTIYQGTGDAGIYHNSTLGLISISSDGTTRYTIQDKNLGATAVWNSGDTMSQDNCGNYYQRGNCYGFPFTGATSTSSSRQYVSEYGPTNYYTDSTFITVSSYPYNWMYSTNKDLWGGVSQGTHSGGGGDMKPKKIYIRVEASPYPLSEYSLNKTVSDFGISSCDGGWVSKDEDFIFLTQSSGNYIYKYALATPGDISSTKTNINTVNLGSYIRPLGICVSDDGMHLYFTRYYSSNYGFTHWTLSNPYDISSYTAVGTSVSNGQPMGVCLGDSGKNVFICGAGPYLNKYTSAEPYGTSYTVTASTPPITGGLRGICFVSTSNGGKRYLNNNGTLRAFDVSIEGDLPSGTASETLSVSGAIGIQFSSDYERFWVRGADAKMYEYKHN